MIRKTHSNTPRMASFCVPSGSSGDSDAIVQQFTKIVTRMSGSNHLDSTIRIALRRGSRQMGKPGKHPSTPAYTLPLGPRTSAPLNPGRRSASRLGMRALSSASASSRALRFLTMGRRIASPKKYPLPVLQEKGRSCEQCDRTLHALAAHRGTSELRASHIV